MATKQYEVWLADLNPQLGTEAGKTRPVLVVQSNFLNQVPHPSALICPITTNVKLNSNLLRIHLKKGDADLLKDCDVMIDQLRAIDNKRLIRKLGLLPSKFYEAIRENLTVVLDLVL